MSLLLQIESESVEVFPHSQAGVLLEQGSPSQPLLLPQTGLQVSEGDGDDDGTNDGDDGSGVDSDEGTNDGNSDGVPHGGGEEDSGGNDNNGGDVGDNRVYNDRVITS